MERRSIDDLRVTPCPLASEFQEPVSLCRVCGREVLDLSQFTREEAVQLLSTSEPPCVRFALSNGRPQFRNALLATSAAALLTGAAALVSLGTARARTGGAVAGKVQWHADPPPAPPSSDFQVVGGAPPSGVDWHP